MPLRSDWNFSSAGLINNPEGPCNNVSILWQRCLPRQQMSGPIIPRLVGLRSESPAYPAVHPGFAVMAKVLARTASRKATHASTFLADGEDHGIAEKWPTRSTHSMEKANLEEVWKNANHRTLMKMVWLVCTPVLDTILTVLLVCRVVEPNSRHEWAGGRTAQYRHANGGD